MNKSVEELSHNPPLDSGRVEIPAGQGLVLSHSCTEQQEGQAGKASKGALGTW